MSIALTLSAALAEEPAATAPELTDQQKQQVRARFKEDAAGILKVIDLWAKAWTDLDADSYIACYSATYTSPQYATTEAWQKARRSRFKSQKWVKLGLTGMVLSLRKNSIYAVEFNQKYESDTYKDSSRKQLLFMNVDGNWRIIAESKVAK